MLILQKRKKYLYFSCGCDAPSLQFDIILGVNLVNILLLSYWSGPQALASHWMEGFENLLIIPTQRGISKTKRQANLLLSMSNFTVHTW
jgi:hypothetical protein